MILRQFAVLGLAVTNLAFCGSRIGSSSAAQPTQQNAAQLDSSFTKDRLTSVDKKLDAEISDLVALYQHLHTNPELSLMETSTSARLAEEMKKLGYEVTEKVGGNGIVAVMKNGPGPVVLIRTGYGCLAHHRANRIGIREQGEDEGLEWQRSGRHACLRPRHSHELLDWHCAGARRDEGPVVRHGRLHGSTCGGSHRRCA